MVAQDYPDADHYSFDDAQTRHTALTDSIAFLDQHGDGLMVIDEFQRAPDFILPPKAEVDTHRGTGRFCPREGPAPPPETHRQTTWPDESSAAGSEV